MCPYMGSAASSYTRYGFPQSMVPEIRHAPNLAQALYAKRVCPRTDACSGEKNSMEPEGPSRSEMRAVPDGVPPGLLKLRGNRLWGIDRSGIFI